MGLNYRSAYIVAMLAACTVVIAQPAAAAVVYWTDWTADTIGALNGSATGTITTPTGNIGVGYSGEVTGETRVNGTASSGYPSWLPASTYADGTIVQDAPTFRDIVAQNGGRGTGLNTIVFSTPIANPVMAIWSLGSPGDDANYTFSGTEPFSIVAGGPSDEYGGGSIVANGGPDSITGVEGNGTIQFIGTYSQITFTNTNFENWFGFTLGVDGIATPTPVPEPASLPLLGVALLGLGLVCGAHRVSFCGRAARTLPVAHHEADQLEPPAPRRGEPRRRGATGGARAA